MRRSLRLQALVACALVVSACGNSTEANDAGGGSPAATGASVPPAAIVSPDLLDVGTYPTAPRPPLGLAGNPGSGAVADAQHMADFAIGPWDVDDGLVTPYVDSFAVLSDPNDLLGLGPPGIAAAARQHGFVNGFASLRQATDRMAMINAVLRFPDPAAASAAPTEMGDAVANQPIKGAVPTVAAIPGHPEAVASTYPFTATGSDVVRATVRSFTAHGPYVFMHFAQSVDGFDAAAALVAKAIDAQGSAIDRFTPAAPSALADVPLDPTGLMARTLPSSSGAADKNAVYTARGAEHFQTDPIASATLFADTGVTAVALGDTNVYEARNDGSAKMITNAFSQEIADGGNTPAEPAKGLPDSQCQALQTGFYCVATAGRYAIEATGEQLLDTQQKLAAQYVMLTAH